MKCRRIAVLIDGGFFIKRLPKLVQPQHYESPKSVAMSARMLCKRNIQRLIGESFKDDSSRWLDNVYRLFYYDALPYTGIAHHPFLNKQVHFGKSAEASFRTQLFDELRRMRKFALRLGQVVKESGWQIKDPKLTKKLLHSTGFLAPLFRSLSMGEKKEQLCEDLEPIQVEQINQFISAWESLGPDGIKLGLRQKGVDMRIGLDISTLTLKNQVDTIILVTGDSDFVPAAKLARREGVEFLLDPLWQSVSADLYEHVDGVVSGFQRPETNHSI